MYVTFSCDAVQQGEGQVVRRVWRKRRPSSSSSAAAGLCDQAGLRALLVAGQRRAPEEETLALLGAGTRPVPVAEGHEGGSSLSGLRGSKVKVNSAELFNY